MKLCWLDVRELGPDRDATVEEAVHQRIDGIVAAELSLLEKLPPTVTKVLIPREPTLPTGLDAADVVIVSPAIHGHPRELAQKYPDVQFGSYIEVSDAPSLELACQAARTEPWTLLRFADPTKIPLEIVIAAAAASRGNLITIASDIQEARIIAGVLEHGSDGVLLTPKRVGDATRLKAALADQTDTLKLTELTVNSLTHVGIGERACVDTCTYLNQDEGILVGSHSKGMILCVSETHPLPYMPIRPFRVNAGAIMSYTLSANGHTNYLSELRAGSQVLAVDVHGGTRLVTVGRVKIETRPLLSIDTVAPDGRTANLILQDDWHVRVLGPGAAVLNSTELKPGDRVLGYLPVEDRHVGYPIAEFCKEQ